MKSRQIAVLSIGGFVLLCGLGLWALRSESPAPAPVQPQPVAAAPKPEPLPAPEPKRAPPPVPAPIAQAQAPLTPPALPTPDEKPIPPKMTPLRPDWQVKRLHFAHNAPTAIEAIRPLVAECFRDNAGQLRAGDQVVLSFSTAQDGHFADGQVESSTVQNPYLQACLQDALHDASTTPGGAQGPLEFVFKYQADGGTEAEPAPF